MGSKHIRYPMPEPKPGVKPVKSAPGWTMEEQTEKELHIITVECGLWSTV